MANLQYKTPRCEGFLLLIKTPAMPCAARFEPAFAGGTLSISFALAEAYRGTNANLEPLKKVLAQNR